MASTCILSSSRCFSFEKPATGVMPVVLNMRSPTGSTPDNISRAIGASGKMWVRWFFVRAPGMVHVLPSSLSSDRRMATTSSRLQPVSSSNLMIASCRFPTVPAAVQNLTISASLRTRSRDFGASGA